MTSRGRVRSWNQSDGWGIVDCADTPGGAWAGGDSIRVSGVADTSGDGFPSVGMRTSTRVDLEWERAQSPVEGCDYLVTAMWPSDSPVPEWLARELSLRSPYRSSLWISVGDPGPDGLVTMVQTRPDDLPGVPGPDAPVLGATDVAGTVRSFDA